MAGTTRRLTSTLLPTMMAIGGQAQEYYEPTKSDSVPLASLSSPASFGLGIGIDYGGLGGQFNYAIHKNIVFLFGLGYNFAGAGVNGGLEGRLLPGGSAHPFLAAMYGYNAVIVVQGASEYNEIYYGPSFGAGVELERRRSHNFWRLALWIPIRPDEFTSDMEDLRNNPNIKMGPTPPGFAISAGYHFND